MTFTLGLAIGLVIGWVIQTYSSPGLVSTINSCITQCGSKTCQLVSGLFSTKPQASSSAPKEAPKTTARTVKTAAPRATNKKSTPAANKRSPARASAKSSDDLRKIEGIGPKIAELLNQDGILSFGDLASARQNRLSGILDKAGSRYRMADSSSWPEQAAIAKSGDWGALKKLQEKLKGGRKTK